MAASEGQPTSERAGGSKPIRVWCDGCFDVAHYGHANQLRQATLVGDVVAGVHPDAEVAAHKGPPVFTERERYRLIAAVKWVQEVVEAAPMQTSLATLDEFRCEVCVHGDDPCLLHDGTDIYTEAKAQKRYREVPRTPGISTTDLSGLPNSIPRPSVSILNLVELFSDHKTPKPGQEVVYVAGAFDVFHIGHLSFLEKVAEAGSFVIVGVHSDALVRGVRGQSPVMSLYERVLGVLAIRYVHEVVIGADYSLSEEFLARRGIGGVAHGRSPVRPDPATGRDPYEVAKRMGILETLDSGSEVRTDDIVRRIADQRAQYVQRNDKKAAMERAANARPKEQDNIHLDGQG